MFIYKNIYISHTQAQNLVFASGLLFFSSWMPSHHYHLIQNVWSWWHVVDCCQNDINSQLFLKNSQKQRRNITTTVVRVVQTLYKCLEHRNISTLKRKLYLLVLLAVHSLDPHTGVKLETGYSLWMWLSSIQHQI